MIQHYSKKPNISIDTLIKELLSKDSDMMDYSILGELKNRFDYLDWKYQKKIIMALLEYGPRNTPIASLIKSFTNKKSGKVVASRDTIKSRYYYLDRKDQIKILQAFLESGKTDRQWAYSELYENWDNSFEQNILNLWKQYHEKLCSWIIIRHFPKEFILRNIESFTEDRNYFFICMRFAKDQDFIVNRNKLSNTDYLAVLYHIGKSIESSEARDVLFNTIHDVCLKPLIEIQVNISLRSFEKGDIICPNQFRVISLALYYLRKLNCGEVVEQFNIWNQTVKRKILDSSEIKKINQNLSRFDRYEYWESMKRIARKYTYINLENKYKETDMPIKLPKINYDGWDLELVGITSINDDNLS